MRLSISRRLLVVGITMPALLTGGLVAASSSNAASTTTHAVVPSAAAGAMARAAAKPCGGLPFRARTDIPGKRGKLIGHASVYAKRDNTFGPGWLSCVVTWRNGVARGNKNITRVNLSWSCRPERPSKTARKNPQRSPTLTVLADCNFTWWGGLRYKGTYYRAAKKTFKVKTGKSVRTP